MDSRRSKWGLMIVARPELPVARVCQIAVPSYANIFSQKKTGYRRGYTVS